MTQDSTAKPGKLYKLPTEWAISEAGEPLIRLPEGLPAGTYQADSAEGFVTIVKTCAERARRMAEVRRWLLDADIDPGKVNDLLMRLNKKADDAAINESISGLMGLGRLF